MFANVKLWFDIGVGILIAGLVVFAGWQYDQAKLARKDTAAATLAMTQLQQGLAQLQQGQRADTAAIRATAASQAVVVQHAATVRQRVVTMGNNDASVQTWLDARVPGAGCMLDDTCGTGAAAGTTQRSASAALH